MRIARLAVALVWLYQGLWCKLLCGCPGHRAAAARDRSLLWGGIEVVDVATAAGSAAR